MDDAETKGSLSLRSDQETARGERELARWQPTNFPEEPKLFFIPGVAFQMSESKKTDSDT